MQLSCQQNSLSSDVSNFMLQENIGLKFKFSSIDLSLCSLVNVCTHERCNSVNKMTIQTMWRDAATLQLALLVQPSTRLPSKNQLFFEHFHQCTIRHFVLIINLCLGKQNKIATQHIKNYQKENTFQNSNFTTENQLPISRKSPKKVLFSSIVMVCQWIL